MLVFVSSSILSFSLFVDVSHIHHYQNIWDWVFFLYVFVRQLLFCCAPQHCRSFGTFYANYNYNFDSIIIISVFLRCVVIFFGFFKMERKTGKPFSTIFVEKTSKYAIKWETRALKMKNTFFRWEYEPKIQEKNLMLME